ncbi:MAG: hypothetical protein ACI9SP_000837 [Arenicella sp.]|jgi:hypothetical protein
MWHIIRVAYFESSKTSILLGPIKDSVEVLQSSFDVPVFVTGHWKFGPHIDICIKCETSVFEEKIFPTCEPIISAWLMENPSKTKLVEKDYEKLSMQLALSELESPPYSPLLQNNKVTVGSYELSKLINIEEFNTSKESFLSDSTPMMFELLSLSESDRSVFFISLVFMMAVVAEKFEKYGIKRGYISFRSHAEYFLENSDTTGRIRDKYNGLDQAYAALIDENIEMVSQGQVNDLDISESVKSILLSWVGVIDKTYEKNSVIAKKNLHLIVGDEGQPTSTEQNMLDLATSISDNVADQVALPSSDFNAGKVVKSALNHQEGRDLMNSPEFIAYRITVNYFYLLLPTLDVTPMQKFSLCHIFANSVERVFGTNWKDIIPSVEDDV